MRKSARLYATVAAIALVIGNALPSAVAGDEPKLPTEEFHDIVQSLIDAENRNDAAAMAALFTEDAILLPPGGGQPIQGQDNIRRFLNEYAKHKMDNHKITPTVLMLGGPRTMIDAGTWSGDAPAQNGAPPTHLTGTYLAVGILVDGQWKLWADSWQTKSDVAASGSSMAPQGGPNK